MSHSRTALAGALPILVTVLALTAAPPAQAKRRGGGSKSTPTAQRAHDNEPSKGTTIHLRSGSSSSSSSTSQSLAPEGGFSPVGSGAQPQRAEDKEEAARRAAAAAAYDRKKAEEQAAKQAALEKLEAQRQAAEKAAADQRSAAERAEAARLAAAAEEKRRAEAAVQADVDRILQRAMADFPVLKTPQGEHVLQMILARQQALIQQRDLYPSIAMVEAVADHAEMLRVRPRLVMPVVSPVSFKSEAPAVDPTAAFGGCRWVNPSKWACPTDATASR